jgi:hypothetical protein
MEIRTFYENMHLSVILEDETIEGRNMIVLNC